ncbi:hypothetical protein SmJEL517_g01103 [Synchytrium microbalum]|uniref:Ubiquitin-like modifier-activating enzyme ATG7 n=1 Tax=Synchytrium microbalum TaxID=1806994 RepID=A0A507CHU2_9FUNG|nr:uncharacterized protein SmJEL517_g01103 [Synchytrium microbalum]TPX37245.1 hypothetical protein SmJEL517_g01103 [Synchytrium microbalum]
MEESNLLQFEPLSSAVEATFWHQFSQRKIDVYKLDDSAVDVYGYYSTGQVLSIPQPKSDAHVAEAIPARLCLGVGAFDGRHVTCGLPPYSFRAPGVLKNTNTIEEFQSVDKNKLFKDTANRIWDDIVSGSAINSPSLLNRFILLTFADLKKYRFYHWFAFPALLPEQTFNVTSAVSISVYFNPEQIESLRTSYNTFRGLPESHEAAPNDTGFFLIRKEEESNTVDVAKLVNWDDFFAKTHESKIMVGFADPSGLSTHPGWPLRNFFALLKKAKGLESVTVVCYRESMSRQSAGPDILNSIVIDVKMPGLFADPPKSVGWEKNAAGKLGPRVADLAPLMDPARLADTAVDLNLKLMRWRIAPALQLEKISSTKCLLLGAGTLGCYVARNLMAWGVRNITFVDSGKVSFTNPVRQPLFSFEDCLDGGKYKAVAAADALKRIFPGVNCVGHVLGILMPGHAVTNMDQAKSDLAELEKLIIAHDAIFLLTDSREARWLPTLLGAAHGKIVVNSALGFDTFLVMRHGMRTAETPSPSSASATTTSEVHLGCYFCNDVVAPTDSLSDRTLDQQCTVTRPGLALMASALAVELLVTILNHPRGPWAPGDVATPISESVNSPTNPLGLLPHQIRGFLSHFSNLLITGQAYDRCTACSHVVLDEYRRRGFEFVRKCLEDPSYLEEVTGLKELYKMTEDVSLDVEDDEDDFE